MEKPNVNVVIGGAANKEFPSVYKTVALKAGIPFASQVTEKNMKYVIKYDFDLGGQRVEMPAGCILEFDGGTVRNGTIAGNGTFVNNVGGVGIDRREEADFHFENLHADPVFDDSVTVEGTWWNVTELYTDRYLSETSLKPVTNRTVTINLKNKVDKIPGKGLSTNDFTNEDKQKLDGISGGAKANVQADWSQDDNTKDDYIKNKPAIPTKVSQLANDSDYATQSQVSSLNSQVSSQVSSLNSRMNTKADKSELSRVATTGNYNDLTGTPAIPEGVTVDSVLSEASANPVQNKVLYGLINNILNLLSGKQDILRSGISIKTVNGASLLGGGDLPINAAGVIVDAILNGDSDNPVRNRVIVDALGRKLNSDDYIVDSELNAGSTNPVQNGTVKAMFDYLQSQINELKNVSTDYNAKLSRLITAFDNVLVSINKPTISSSNDLYNYLNTYYKAAVKVFTDDDNPLFLPSTYEELDGDPKGLHGTNTALKDRTFDAMSSWLFAMCLSELLPSESASSGNAALTNNQTKFFKAAWDYADGDTTGLYGGYDVHADPMIGRYVAAAIYVTLRGRMSYSDVNSLRVKLGGSTISSRSFAEDLSDIVETDLHYDGTDWNGGTTGPTKSVGYLVNTYAVVPPAPGPFAIGYDANRDLPYGAGKQDEDLFYKNNEGGRNWLKGNYKKDVELDDYIVSKYNLLVRDENGNVTGSVNPRLTKQEKNDFLYAGTIARADSFGFFGSKRVKYNGFDSNKYLFAETNETPTETNEVYDIAGPFAEFKNVFFGSTDANHPNGIFTVAGNFMGNVCAAADDGRFPNYKWFGRRRPLGGTELSGTSRRDNQTDPLNGIYMSQLASMFADTKAKKDLWYKDIDFPHDPAKSYPSGHQAQMWAAALMLSQMRAGNVSDYSETARLMKKAYKMGVYRTLGRFHWNSDVMYGRLFATMMMPILNAMTGVISNYDAVKAAYGGQNAAEPSGKGGITLTITNRTNVAMSIQRRMRVCVWDGTTVQRPHVFFDSDPNGEWRIGPGETKSISGGYINSGVDYVGCAIATEAQVAGTQAGNILLYEYGTNNTDVYKVQYATGKFVTNATYNIIYEGGSGSRQNVGNGNIKIVVKNESGKDVTIKERVAFRLSWQAGDGSEMGPDIVDNRQAPDVTIPNGGTKEFSGISVAGNSYLGKAFATQAELDAFADGLSSNIALYDSKWNNFTIIPGPIPSTETFRGGATYVVSIGGESSVVDDTAPSDPSESESRGSVTITQNGNAEPSPTVDGCSMNLTIINNSGRDAVFNGEIAAYLNGGGISGGHERVYMNLPYTAKDRNRFRIAAGESRVFNNVTKAYSPTNALSLSKADGLSVEQAVASGAHFESGSGRDYCRVYVYCDRYGDIANGVFSPNYSGHHDGVITAAFTPNNTTLARINSGTITITGVEASTDNIAEKGQVHYTLSDN